jgi:hypothetical protein
LGSTPTSWLYQQTIAAPSTTTTVSSTIVHEWACFDYSDYLFWQENYPGVGFTPSTTSWNPLRLIGFVNKPSWLHRRPLRLVDNLSQIKLSHLYLFRLVFHMVRLSMGMKPSRATLRCLLFAQRAFSSQAMSCLFPTVCMVRPATRAVGLHPISALHERFLFSRSGDCSSFLSTIATIPG